MGKTSYVIALGSNRRHHQHGSPVQVLAAARAALADHGLEILGVSRIDCTDAMGPAGRAFANGALLVGSDKDPASLLRLLKSVERSFGRRPGRRWGPRVLDLDIILWSEGIWAEAGLAIPHPGFRQRRFVLDPVIAIAPGWRDPVTGLTTRQLHARLMRSKPVDRRGPHA